MFIKKLVKNTTFSFVACTILYSNIYADYITVRPGDYSLPDNLIYDQEKNVLEMIPEYPIVLV